MADPSNPAESSGGSGKLGKFPSKTDEEAMSEMETEYDGGSAETDGLSNTQDLDLAQFVNEHVFKTGDIIEDNGALLRKIRKRIDDTGIEQPEVEVRYQGLTAVAKVPIGSRGTPTLLNTFLEIIDTLLGAIGVSNSKKEEITILDHLDGVLKPGRMTLLLGPPASGKSTLLQALANHSDTSLKISGEITYNGHKFSEFQPRKTSSYTSQDNVHVPEYTPRETMGYAAIFQGTGPQMDFLSQIIEREKELGIQPDPDVDVFMKASVTPGISSQVVTEYYMKLLGLEVCADTIVGDHMLKGLSGGQIKRLTTGEMVVSPAPVLFMDDISTGLDSSTTFQIVSCMGQFARILHKTILMSLLQPAPEIFKIFDDVILLATGQIVYHGPCKDVEEFFVTQGFKRPKRKGIADYLQEVTSRKDQQQYWADKNKPYRFIAAHQFAAAFKDYSTGKLISQELGTPFQKSESHTKSLAFDYFSLPWKELFNVTLKFESLYFKKTSVIEIFLVTQLVVTSGIISAIFWRTRRNRSTLTGAQEYAGGLFLMYLTLTLLGFGEITKFSRRFRVLTKFREKQYYPPWAWAFSAALIKIPCSLIEALTCVGLIYYLVGYAPSAARFFRLIFFMATMTNMSSALFRMMASLLRYPVLSSSLGTYVMLILILQGGFILQRSDIRKWWIWAYWALPLSYGQNAIIVNEFLDHRWKKPRVGDNHTLGHRFIKNRSLFDRGYWFWLALMVELGFTVLYIIFLSIFLTVLKAPSKGRTTMSRVQLNEWKRRDYDQSEDVSPQQKTLTGSGRFQSLSDGSRTSSGRSNNASTSEAQPFSRKSDETFSDKRTLSRERSKDNQSKISQAINWDARGMVLPFQPYTITFKDVNYSVNMPKAYKDRGATEEKLQLLHNITGAFRPGVLTALVGVTGAGKSTLMDVLSGRKTKGYTEGDIRINGYPKRHETFTRIAGYCEQFDIHSTKLTVRESVTFSAWLRLDPEVEDEIKRDFIEEVIDLVELDPIVDAIVGVPGESGLSTEERKRLTIAVELVANPSIIFMDEPTSGLDARAAATVMRAVRNTVDTGRTVVCTIHQPSIDIFESFDELLLLKRGGYMIYAGPLGTQSQHLVEYFKSNANVPQIESEENPAAWMLNVTQPGVEQKLSVDFADIYRQSSAYKDMENLVDSLSTPPENVQDIEFSTDYALSMWGQFVMCFWRQWRTYWRSPEYNLMRILLAFGVSALQGSLCWAWGRKLNTEKNIHTFIGVIYISNGLYGMTTCQAVQPVVYSERIAFYRERGARMYSALPFAVAQFLVEVPYIFVASTIFHTIFFVTLRFPWDVDKFFWLFYFQFASQILHVLLGLITLSMAPNTELGSLIALTLIMLWSFSAGFAMPLPAMPIWTKWLFWSNPQAIVIYGSVVAVLGKVDDVFFYTRENVYISVEKYVRDIIGFKHSYLPLIASLSAMYPFLCVAGFVLCIKYLNYQQR